MGISLTNHIALGKVKLNVSAINSSSDGVFLLYNMHSHVTQSYKFDEGMTWAEWCESDYSGGEFYVVASGSSTLVMNGQQCAILDGYASCKGTDKIKAKTYNLTPIV